MSDNKIPVTGDGPRTRRAREAEALRENLRRRKEQQRARGKASHATCKDVSDGDSGAISVPGRNDPAG